jgi:hypothetical protein
MLYLSFDDNIPLDDGALRRIEQNLTALRRVIERRQDCPAPFGAAGNWGKSFFLDAACLVGQGQPDTLNRLLWYTTAFTGMRPVLWAKKSGLWSTDPIPADHRRIGHKNVNNFGDVVAEFESVRRTASGLALAPVPPIMGQTGIWHDGTILNPTNCRYYAQLVSLYLGGALPEHGTLVEIGGGYGGLAYLIRKARPNLRYIAIHLPESLLFAAAYLAGALPDEDTQIVTSPDDAIEARLILCPSDFAPALFEALPRIDAAINFASFGEMGEAAVDYYARMLSDRLAGVLYEANQSAAPFINCDVAAVLGRHLERPEYPTLPFRKVDGEHRLWRRPASGTTAVPQ